MGWSDCGTDSLGRPIGYSHEATCDYPGCDKKIARGLAYACGSVHGFNGDDCCEGYFCSNHLYFCGKGHQLCEACMIKSREKKNNGILRIVSSHQTRFETINRRLMDYLTELGLVESVREGCDKSRLGEIVKTIMNSSKKLKLAIRHKDNDIIIGCKFDETEKK
jgi:hypothetical protein